MSEMKKTDTKPAAPIFVPKDESSNTVELTLDETLVKIAELFRQFAPLKKQLENLKVVAKTHLKNKKLTKYEMPDGTKAQFIESQKPKINKELAKELCGARWAEVETFDTVTSFKVTVPGVKSPDAD